MRVASHYLKNPTPDDGLSLDLLLHDDDTPFLNIDSDQTLDPTQNNPLTSTVPSPTVPSPTNSQSSHDSTPKIVVPYKNDRGSTTLHYDDRDYTLKYAHKLKQESTWRSVSRTCSGKLFVKTDYSFIVELKTTQVITLYSNNISTCIPLPSTIVARSRVVRSSPSLTTRVAAGLMGIDYTSSLRRSRKQRLKSEAQQTSSNVNKKSKTGD